MQLTPDAPVDETTGMSDVEYAAEDIADGLDGIEQQEFYDYYTGRIDTPLATLLQSSDKLPTPTLRLQEMRRGQLLCSLFTVLL